MGRLCGPWWVGCYPDIILGIWGTHLGVTVAWHMTNFILKHIDLLTSEEVVAVEVAWVLHACISYLFSGVVAIYRGQVLGTEFGFSVDL